MFQSAKQRMRVVLDIVDDMLVGAPQPEDEPAPHPHRRPVQLRVARRAGAVAGRPMHCVSPVRPAGYAEVVRRAVER